MNILILVHTFVLGFALVTMIAFILWFDFYLCVTVPKSKPIPCNSLLQPRSRSRTRTPSRGYTTAAAPSLFFFLISGRQSQVFFIPGPSR
jgi:hypothetical protein